MKKYNNFITEKFNQDLIDELTDKGWDNLSKEEKAYLKNPDKVELKTKSQEKEKKDLSKTQEKDLSKTQETSKLLNKWKNDSLQKSIDDKKKWNETTTKNLVKTIDLSSDYGAVVSISWHLLYDFIEENYSDFNEHQIHDIIKNILDAKIVGEGEDIDFKFIDKEYTKNRMLWFNVSYDSRIKTAFSDFNEYEKFWIPKLFGAHNFNQIRIEDYKNKYKNRRR
jgi:hypothetical protein